MASIRTGIVFAITVGVFYALCTLVWVLAPGPFLAFMNNLFHGMDFSALVQPGPFAWSGFCPSQADRRTRMTGSQRKER